MRAASWMDICESVGHTRSSSRISIHRTGAGGKHELPERYAAAHSVDWTGRSVSKQRLKGIVRGEYTISRKICQLVVAPIFARSTTYFYPRNAHRRMFMNFGGVPCIRIATRKMRPPAQTKSSVHSST